VQLELAGRSMKGMLKQAARLDAGYVAVVSDERIELKDMETGEQEPVESAAAVVARVLRGRHPA
jgi:histidyl-tRNA synthetase